MIEAEKNEPDFVNVGGEGDPSIVRKEAETEVLVKDGDTTVIGGIYTQEERSQTNKVPVLGDLPYVGFLFKQNQKVDNRNELLIFMLGLIQRL
jgi:type IV pilus assembly protein PilQ